MPVISAPRVLLVGPRWGGMWTESTQRALEELGCAVQPFYYNRLETDQQGRDVPRRILRRIRSSVAAAPNVLMQLVGIWFGHQIGRRLVRVAVSVRPDVILVLKGEWLLPNTLRQLKEDTGAVLATWWVDNPLRFRERHPWIVFSHSVPIYDHVFVFDHSYCDRLRALGARRVSFLPCAADLSVYHPERVGDGDRRRLASSICLIGAFYEARGRVIERLLGFPGLAIWGPGWGAFLKSFRNDYVSRIWRGPSVSGAEANRIYQVADIVLNTHHPQSKHGGLNVRAFEIPASGAFEMMDYVPGTEELLAPGSEVVCFRSPEEAEALAKVYLKDAQLRSRVAQAGRKRVLREHTYAHRMRVVLASL